MASVYDSERLAVGYAFDRPPVHEQILRSARLARRADRALDVGCGAGLSTAALAPLARQVVGLEPVPAMLAHRRTVAPRARFVIGRAEWLPFPAESFDLVAAAGSLNYADLPLASRRDSAGAHTRRPRAGIAAVGADAVQPYPPLARRGDHRDLVGTGGSGARAQLIEQLPEARASALWNLAYDAGYGAGPAVFGLICVRTGYPSAFALTAVLILAAVPLAVREQKAVAGEQSGVKPPGRAFPRRSSRGRCARPPRCDSR